MTMLLPQPSLLQSGDVVAGRHREQVFVSKYPPFQNRLKKLSIRIDQLLILTFFQV